MSDIRGMAQTALDAALYPHVLTHWQRKSGPDADEYIVYTQSGDSSEAQADNKPLVKAASITVRYYYRAEKLDTHTGRQAVKAREVAIEAALVGAGLTIPFGKFDAGDVDDIGYFVTVFECDYWRVV
jgi:hypothetical protein